MWLLIYDHFLLWVAWWVGLAECIAAIVTLGFFQPTWHLKYLSWCMTYLSGLRGEVNG